MASPALRREEGLGLGVAVVLHLLLVAALLFRPAPKPLTPPVEAVTVNLAEEVGLDAEGPELVSESRAAMAPELAPLPVPPVPEQAASEPAPQPRATTAPAPRRTSAPPRTRREPTPRRSQTPRTRPSQPAERPRGSRLNDNFLAGGGDSSTSQETRLPASQIGASARASLVQAIAREIKPHWQPPSGPEVESIVTVLRFRLNEDGSLAGRPSVVRQRGVNSINRAQADRHAELAIRSVQRAAPFDLPEEYYNAWKNISAFSFDWKLSQ